MMTVQHCDLCGVVASSYWASKDGAVCRRCQEGMIRRGENSMGAPIPQIQEIPTYMRTSQSKRGGHKIDSNGRPTSWDEIQKPSEKVTPTVQETPKDHRRIEIP